MECSYLQVLNYLKENIFFKPVQQCFGIFMLKLTNFMVLPSGCRS